MRDPFLCPDCQKLGYCRKYNTKPQERNFDKEEEAFFQRVNKPTVKVDQALPATPVKLISLEKMRTHFRNQTGRKDAVADPTRGPGTYDDNYEFGDDSKA